VSRSTYVYIARDNDGELLGAWTVKYELARWLRDTHRDNPMSRRDLTEVTRLRDNDPGARPVALNPRTLEPVR
jgi:hypothetical protein